MAAGLSMRWNLRLSIALSIRSQGSASMSTAARWVVSNGVIQGDTWSWVRKTAGAGLPGG